MSIAFMLLGLGLWIRWKAGQAASWPRTQAWILESKVVKDPHDSDTSFVILYRYEVAGRIHECGNLGYFLP